MRHPIQLTSFLLTVALAACSAGIVTAEWGECAQVGETHAIPPTPICTRTDSASGAVESCECPLPCETPALTVGNDATKVWADIIASHNGTATFNAQDSHFDAGFSHHEWSYACGMPRTIFVGVWGADGTACRADASAGACP